MNRHHRISTIYTAITWTLIALMVEPQTRLVGQESSSYVRALEVLLAPASKSSSTPASPAPILMAQAQSPLPVLGGEGERVSATVDTNLVLGLTRTPITLTNDHEMLGLSFFSDSNHNYVVEFRDEIGFDLCNQWQPLTNAPHNYGIVFTESQATNRFFRLRRIDTPRAPLFALLAHDTGTNSLDGITSDSTITGMALKFPARTELQASLNNPTGPFTVITNLGSPRYFLLTRDQLATLNGGSLPDGSHTLYLRAMNGAATLGSFDLPFTLDTAPPTVTVSLAPDFDSPPLGDGRTAFSPVTLNGQTEPGTRIELLATTSPGGASTPVIHKVVPDANGSFVLTNIVLAQGTNQFYFRALDAACNESISESRVCWYGSECAFPDNLEGWQVAVSPTVGFPGSVTVAPDKLCTAIMSEGDSFLVALSRDFSVPTIPSVLSLNYQAIFDTAATHLMRDAFEVALVDDVGRPLTYTIQGTNAVTPASVATPPALPPSPDALLNHFDGRAPFVAPGVAMTSQPSTPQFSTLLVDVRHLPPGSAARLVLRLVNNDQDSATTIRIADVQFKPFGSEMNLSGPIPPALSVLSLSTIANDFSLLSSDCRTGIMETALNGSKVVSTLSNSSLTTPSLAIESPSNNAQVAPGKTMLTGSATAFRFEPSTNGPVFVSVNGAPVDALDVAGNFFNVIDIKPGHNEFEVVATDAVNQSATNTVSVYGTTCPQNFAGLGKVTASVEPEYGRTSFNERTKVLYADLALRNVGTYPIRAPFYVGITRISDPSVKLLAPDGVSADGIPFYDYSDALADSALGVGQLLLPRALAFHNPTKVQFTYDLVVLGQLNQAPAFTTIPILEGIVGKSYAYRFSASDPDGDVLTYSLVTGPSNMVLNVQLTSLTFQPSTVDIGTHNIRLLADDGKGGNVEQHYLLSVINQPSNRPPHFISKPVTLARLSNNALPQTIPIDLGRWSVIQLQTNAPEQGAAQWILGESNTVARQLQNADASILLSEFVVENEEISGTWVTGGGDDDYMGFVFGYQNRGQFYLFDWKHGDQNDVLCGYALAGMNVKIVSANSELDCLDLWPTISTNNRVETLFHNQIPWESNVGYYFTISSRPGSFRIRVNDMNRMLLDETFYDEFYVGGGFGFYNYSQGDVRYSGFSRQSLPYSAYTYNSLAVDADGDSLTYSFASANRYPLSVHTSSPIGYWRLDEAKHPNALDSSNYGNDGAYYGAVSFGRKGALDGGANTAIHFGGGGVSVEDSSIHRPAALTVEAWVKPISLTTWSSAVMKSTLGAWGDGFGLAHYIGSDGISFFVNAFNTSYVTAPLELGIWTHLAGTYDGLTLKLYTNGVLASSLSYSTPIIHSTEPLLIGSGAGGYPWHGSIDEVALYDHALPPEVIREHYELGVSNYVLAPSNMTINPFTGAIAWNPSVDQIGDHDVTVQVHDGRGGTNFQSYRICVLPTEENRPPIIVSCPQTEYAFPQVVITSQIVALDPDFDILTYELVNGPDGMSLNPTNGVLSWNPSVSVIGSQPVVVRVSDGKGGIDEQSFQVASKPCASSEIGGQVTSASQPLAGWNVYLDANSNELRDSCERMTVTDSDGRYRFQCVETGCYVVRTESQLGWQQIGPLISTTQTENLLQNGGFEQILAEVPFRPGSILFTNLDQRLPGWTIINSDEDFLGVNRNAFSHGFPPSEGIYHVLFNGGNREPGGSLYQTICTIPGGKYTVRLFVARDGNGDGNVSLTASAISSDGTVLTSYTAQAPPVSGFYALPHTFTFTASDNQTTLKLSDTSTATVSVDIYFDDVSVVGSVAEGSQFVRVLDDSSAISSVDFHFERRTNDLVNAQPVFLSVAPQVPIQAGQKFLYQSVARDADGDALSFDLVSHPEGMLVENKSGIVAWRPLLRQLGTHDVILRVQDGRGGVALQSWQITVIAPNSAPVITSFPPGPAVVGLPYRYRVQAQDAEGGPLNFVLGGNAPTGVVLAKDSPATTVEQSAVLSWTPFLTNLGRNTIEIVVRDESGAESRQEFELEVVPADSPNRAPQFLSMPRIQARLGMAYTYLVRATDPDGDPVAFELVEHPAGMTLTNSPSSSLNAQVVSWSANQPGSNFVHLRITDGGNGTNDQMFAVLVTSTLANSAPVIVSTPPVHGTAGQPYVYDLRAEDADGDAVVWSLVQAPIGASLDSASGTLRWNPTLEQLGSNNVVVEVRDALLGRVTQTWQIDVGCVNRPPQITSVPPTQANVDEPYLYALRAEDPDEDSLTFSFVDSAAVPVGMTLTNLTASGTRGIGGAVLRWIPTTNQAGAYLVRLRVRDGRGGENEQNYTLHVINQRANKAPFFVTTPGRMARVSDAPSSVTNLILNGSFEDGPLGVVNVGFSGGSTGIPDWVVTGNDVHYVRSLYWTGSDGEASIDLDGSANGGLAQTIVTIPGQSYELHIQLAGNAWSLPSVKTMVVTAADQQTEFSYDVGDQNQSTYNLHWEARTWQFVATSNQTTVALNSTTQPQGFGPVIDEVELYRVESASFVYNSRAIDPESQTLTYSLPLAPFNASIDSVSGAIRWNPTPEQTGSHEFIVVARDPLGASASQRFSVLVRSNQSPSIVSVPRTNAIPGIAYRYDVNARDPDGDALTYSFTSPVPSGMFIDTLGRISWTPALAQTGIFLIAVMATDPFGGTSSQSFRLVVTADTQPPTVELELVQGLVNTASGQWSGKLGDRLLVQVNASDNVAVAARQLYLDETPVPLSSGYVGSIAMDRSGIFNLTGVAIDLAGNSNAVTRSVVFFDPRATNQLAIRIHNPTNDNIITAPVDVVATITNGAPILSYSWGYALRSEVNPLGVSVIDPEVTILGTSNLPPNTTSLENFFVGRFDPTILQNDDYVLVVGATDSAGVITTEPVEVSVQGNLKFGELRLEFTDLAIPVAGIPIQIQRIYDSRDARREGDFGYGWSLGVQDAVIRESVRAESSFRPNTRVYLNSPDGRRLGFSFAPVIISGSLFGGVLRPQFVADAGVYDRLEVPNEEFSFEGAGIVGDVFEGLGAYNPDTYFLTTRDGTRYEYDQNAGLKNVADRNGNRLVYTRDGIFHYNAGSVVPDQSVQFLRDTRGRITRIIDPNGKAITYAYDGAGDLRSFADQVTNTTRYAYAASRAHFLTNIVDPLGRSALHMEYDLAGRLKTVTDANGNVISQDFDATTKAATFTDGNGTTIHARFDENGNEVMRRIDGIYTNTFAYEANNNLLASTNGRGFSTNYTYDARGNVTTIRDSLGNRTAIAYNEQNKPVGVTNALGQILNLSYNTSGQLTQVVNNAGFKTSVGRDAQGRVVSLTDATGTNTTIFDYSNGCACGRPGKVINPDGSFRLYEYNSQGLTNRVVNELAAETLFHHDASGKLLWMRDPLTNYTQFFYNGPLLTNVVDALGRSTRYEYDALNRTNKIIDAENGVVEFRYDNNGNRTHVIDAVTNVTTFIYDAGNRLAQQIDPLGQTNFFGYDAAGNRTEAIDRNGRKRTFRYDAANRMTNEFWWEGTNVVRAIVFGFNELGVQTFAADPAARYEYSYDALNRLERVLSQSAGVPDFTLLYTYTALGQVASVTDHWGARVGSGYDNRNRLASRTWSSTLPGAGVDPARVDFVYDVSGNRLRTDRFADLAGTNRIGFTTNAYNRAGIVTNITHLGPASQVLAKYDYNFDAAYQLTHWAIGGQLSDFAYDRTGQLTNALNTAQPNENFRFDANGNRVGAQSGGSYVVGRNNQILGDGTNHYAYDAEGNMTSRSNTLTGVVTLYHFDHRNRLVSVVDRNPGGVVTQTVTFVYDAMNRRLSKTVSGQQTTNVVRFLYNQDDSWADLDGTSAVTARYLHGARIDELLARQRASDGRGWYLTDHLGTVRDIANAAGAVVAHVDYSSFGLLLGVSNPSAVDRFLFTGRELDEETGLYFYRARYYSATLGNFISQDPIGFIAQGFNLYRYCSNNPLSLLDPNGTDFIGNALIRVHIAIQSYVATVNLGLVVKRVIIIVACALSAYALGVPETGQARAVQGALLLTCLKELLF